MAYSLSWHADIKPSNILSMLETYKLADPGFARFEQKRDSSAKKLPPQVLLEGGTATYGMHASISLLGNNVLNV